MKTRLYFMLPLLSLFLTACSTDMMSVIFDVPPPTPEQQARERARAVAKKQAEQNKVAFEAAELKKMPPHRLAGKLAVAKDWGEAQKYIPKDKLGQPDWLAAMAQNIIQPRSHIGTDRINKFVFEYDFYIKGPTPMFDAWFPHSSHTKLLDCSSCHPKVFKYRGTKITMKDINAGKYCGTCHGRVAFPVATACARCHTYMPGGG